MAENIGQGPGTLGSREKMVNYGKDDGGGNGETPDWVKAMGIEYSSGRNVFEGSVADQFVDGAKNLSRLKAKLHSANGEEIGKINKEILSQREKLRGLREEIFYDQLGLVDGLHEDMLGFQSPYPYESKYGANFINMLEEKINKELGLKRKEKLEEETLLVLKEMREANLWIKGNYNILEGLGSAMKAYYDGEMQGDMLYSLFKRILAGDWKKAFAAEIKGASLSVEEKQKLADYGYINKDKKETLRDEAVRYSDDQMFWTMAIASAGQWDHHNNKHTERSMALNDEELLFVQKLFGVSEKEKTPLECSHDDFVEFNGKKIPRTVFGWFAMDGSSEERLNTFEVMMRVVLQKDIKGRFDRGEDVDLLIKEVKEESRRVINDVGVDSPEGLEEKLAFAVFNQNLIMVNGLMASGDLGWRFDYEVIANPNGPKTLERKLELGSIYTAFDVATIYYWMLHKIIYDGRAEDRSTLMPPSVGEFRKMFDNQPPHFKLDIWKYCTDVGDKKMLAMLNLLESNPADMLGKGKSLREAPLRASGESFGDINPLFLRFLKENMSAFMVPFYEEKMMDPKTNKEKPKWMVLPVSIPPVIDSLNFFRAIGHSKKDKESFFEKLLNRSEKMSSLNWNKTTRQAFDGWRVSTAQMHKLTIFLIGTHELDKDKEMAFKTFFETVRGVAFKSMDKRGRLGLRMENEEKGVWSMAFVPFLVALGAAKQNHLFGQDLFTAPKGDIHSFTQNFRRAIASWMNVALDMPADAYDMKNFNGSMAFMIFWYGTILERIATAAKTNYETNYSDIKANIVDAGGLMDKMEKI